MISAWRTGIFKTVGSALLDKEILDRLVSMVPATRALTRGVFSHLWGLFFAWLDSRGEMEALRVLKRYYFLPDNFASWNGGIDTVMPGSYSGSQAQEAWHRVKLRPTLETLKIPVEEVLVKLNGLVASRLEQAKLRYVSLEDAPALQWCPRLCAEGQDYLSATEFMRTKCLPDGTSCWIFRSSDVSMAEPLGLHSWPFRQVLKVFPECPALSRGHPFLSENPRNSMQG